MKSGSNNQSNFFNNIMDKESERYSKKSKLSRSGVCILSENNSKNSKKSCSPMPIDLKIEQKRSRSSSFCESIKKEQKIVSHLQIEEDKPSSAEAISADDSKLEESKAHSDNIKIVNRDYACGQNQLKDT